MTGSVKDNPCHNCPKRTSACHDSCESHKLWKAEKKAREDFVRKENDTMDKVLSVHRNAVEKAAKGRNRKKERCKE